MRPEARFVAFLSVLLAACDGPRYAGADVAGWKARLEGGAAWSCAGD